MNCHGKCCKIDFNFDSIEDACEDIVEKLSDKKQ